MSKNEPKIEVSWNEKTQKMTIEETTTTAGKERYVRETFTKDAAVKLQTNTNTQCTNIQNFLTKAEECRDLHGKMKDLPMYKEIENINKGMAWVQDQKMQSTYTQALKDIEMMKIQQEAINKALPVFKNA